MSALSAMVNAAPESVSARASVSVHQRIEDVADAWQRLENAH